MQLELFTTNEPARKCPKVFYGVFDLRTGKELARFDDEKTARRFRPMIQSTKQ